MAASSAETFEPPFEPGFRGYARIEDLKPFHLEAETYVERDNEDLVESIAEHGFYDDERLVVTPDGTIIKGHRRKDAAEQNGLERVPIEVVDVAPDSHKATAMFLTSNQYRDKAPAERINEAVHWENVIEEAASSADGPNLVNRQRRGGMETAADRAGLGRESYRKGKKVKEIAEDGDPLAQAAWEQLETGAESIHGAYTTVMKARKPDESDESESDDTADDDEPDAEPEDDEPDGEDDPDESSSGKIVDTQPGPGRESETGTGSTQTTEIDTDSDTPVQDALDEVEAEVDDAGEGSPQTEYDEELGEPGVPSGEGTPWDELAEQHREERASDDTGSSASEQVLRSRLARANSRIDELETLAKRFIRAVDNEDPEAIRAAAEEAEGLVADA